MLGYVYYIALCSLTMISGCAADDKLLAFYQAEGMVIDGDLSDWPRTSKAITVTDRVINQGGKERPLSDNEISCRSAWEEGFLYLAFEVKDTKLNAVRTERDHKELYLDDMVEFLFDPMQQRANQWLPDDIVYHINILGTVKDDRGVTSGDRKDKDIAWNGVAKYALRLKGTLNDDNDVDEGYILEVAVPWEELGITPIETLTLGFNFANGDNDGKGRQLFDWKGAWPMRSPIQFGVIKLVKD